MAADRLCGLCRLRADHHTDNWEAVFKPVFRRKTFVQEAFQRLYPIRICTMHARLITQDDELYLYVEIKRILSAIGIEV